MNDAILLKRDCCHCVDYATCKGKDEYCHGLWGKNTMMELKPCPFCGGTAKFVSGIKCTPIYDSDGAAIDIDDMVYWERTFCTECGIEYSVWDEDIEEGITIQRWNRRAENES